MKKVAMGAVAPAMETQSNPFVDPLGVIGAESITVDFGSNLLWPAEASTWQMCAPDVLERLRAAYHGTGPQLVVKVGPTPDKHYGAVLVEQGKAHVHLVAVWPVDTLLPKGCPEGPDRGYIRDLITEYFKTCWGGEQTAPIGAEVTETIQTADFSLLMAQISTLACTDLSDIENDSLFSFREWLLGVIEDCLSNALCNRELAEDKTKKDAMKPFIAWARRHTAPKKGASGIIIRTSW